MFEVKILVSGFPHIIIIVNVDVKYLDEISSSNINIVYLHHSHGFFHE